MGHINNLLHYDYFQKKLRISPLNAQVVFLPRRRYSSEPGVPCCLRPLQLPPSGHRVLAPSLSCLPWAPTLEPGSVTVHANQQPAKHLCPSLWKGHTWWRLPYFSWFSSHFQLYIAISQKGHQNKVRSGCFCHSSLSQSQEDVGEKMDWATCARNRTFLGWLAWVWGLSGRLPVEQYWKEHQELLRSAWGPSFLDRGAGGRHGVPAGGLPGSSLLQLSSHALSTLSLFSASILFFSASLLQQPSKFLYFLVQILEGLDWLT